MLLRLWKFIRNRTNREFLSWLGGGAVVIVAGAWTLFTYLHEDKKPTPSTTNVIAPAGAGITSGRDTVVNAPVNIGLNEKQVGQQVTDAQKPLTEQLEKLAAQVARDKGVEVAPLRAILVKFGEAGVRDEDISERLDEKADELIRLREEIAKLRQGPAELASYAQQAQTLIEKGEFDGARSALASGKDAAHGMRERSSGYEAAFLAQDAKIDHLQLAYRSASTKYADAARLMETVDQRQQWEFLMAQARELYNQGNEFSNNPALVESIAIYRKCLLLAPRALRSLDWARAQVGLGSALRVLGQREPETARLEEAVSAYRGALQENTRQREPFDWAMTQNNLGFALLRLGERESGSAKLEEAATAFREALQEWTRGRAPLQWAMAQKNLGLALVELGRRERGTARLIEAIGTLREALQGNTRASAPLQWAFIQNNLGGALKVLGEREPGTARLEEAVSAYREALKEHTRARMPLQWAMSTGGQGIALMLLAERRGDEEMARLAVQQIEAAVTTFREGGDARSTAIYEARLLKAHALADKLTRR
jgi:tetratricopeptide (TPR) repeat protein